MRGLINITSNKFYTKYLLNFLLITLKQTFATHE